MRARVGSSIAVLALVLALAAPAVAQQAPTLGAPPTPDVTVNTGPATPVSTDSSGGGLATWQEALIFAAGLILIVGIAVAILADSRERAARLGHGRAATEPGTAPHRHKQRSKQQARAKTKAQREARRRNR
jgi:hypothetical protein